MKKHYLFACVLAVLSVNVAVAQKKNTQKVIYKWTENGLIHYSHVKPAKVKDFIRLDTKGRKIEDFSKDFGEVQEIIVRPSKNQKVDTKDSKDDSKSNLEKDSEQQAAAIAAKEAKQRSCNTAKNNLKLLQGGEVYERDAKGNMIRLSKEQIESKLKSVNKDVGYYCSE